METTDTHTWKKNIELHPDPTLYGRRADSWWTGLSPRDKKCPGLDSQGVIRSLPMPILTGLGKQALREYFDNSWALTETIFAALQGPEAFYQPPRHGLRHPLIFYFAHPAVFYVNKLRVAGLQDGPIDKDFEQLFEVGVDEMSWDDMSLADTAWPSVADVRAYRAKVYQCVVNAIDTVYGDKDSLDFHWSEQNWVLPMGMEHERIHIETSTVLVRELPLSLLRKPEEWPESHPGANPKSENSTLTLKSCDGGKIDLGKARDCPSYGWDNEYGVRKATVRPFEASTSQISNGDFLEFVKAGGYREQSFWSEEGWSWRCFGNTKWPSFWVPDGPEGLNSYVLRTCFEERPLALDWPVVVNAHEALAYANWKTKADGDSKRPYRLLTEAEHWYLRDEASRTKQDQRERDTVHRESGHALKAEGKANTQLAYSSEGPSQAFQATDQGFYDVLGNLWEWCEDHQHPFEGFEVHKFYDDFTTPCFRGEHQLIHGGSFASTGNQASIWGRYQFRPHFFQHAGFRIARPLEAGAPSDSILINHGDEDKYETDAVLGQYMTLHFGSGEDSFPWKKLGISPEVPFPIEVARRMIEVAKEHKLEPKKAIDIGCAVGASTFELSKICPDTLGVDLSERFIEVAQILTKQGHFDYR
ncbi:MAG: 5-histidylcysteine sulfoxide synthase, partial [Planctomycetota bacterium]|nr:5-histidylcysteine sulfoxide synthase [Planctomycetota bacterium]